MSLLSSHHHLGTYVDTGQVNVGQDMNSHFEHKDLFSLDDDCEVELVAMTTCCCCQGHHSHYGDIEMAHCLNTDDWMNS